MNIIEDIVYEMKANTFIVEENRKNAIELALRDSNEDDVVLIAGKGHENTQEISGEYFDFSDREVVESIFSELFGEEV